MADFKFDAVIFDLDGLLLDTESVAIKSGIEGLAALGHTVEESVMHDLVGVDDREAHRRICVRLGVDLDYVVTSAAMREAFRKRLEQGVPLRPGVAAILDALDAINLPRAVATNSQTEGATWKIGKAGLTGRFDAIVGVDQVGAAKPAPDVYLEAARQLGIDPARCLAFEDSDLGVKAALAAGMTVVQIPDMTPSVDRLAHFQAEDLVSAMGLVEIPDYIKG